MNASVHLLRRSLPAVAHLQADIPEDHPSAGILGAERMGTGVVLGSGNHLVTAHYVLIGARSLEITWNDGAQQTGQVVGIDYASGLGVVAFDGEARRGLVARAIDDVVTGEECFVVASVGEGRQVRTGFVSSIGPFDAFWEYVVDRGILSTPENPGLGGGPLIDARGQVIGICALSLAELGKLTFAIPASLAQPLLDQVRARGSYAAKLARAWLGLTCYSIRNHVVLAGVIPDSPAARAGLQPGDLVVALDGKAVTGRRELFEQLWQHRSGETVSLRIFRDDRKIDLEVQSGSIEAFFAARAP